MLTIVRHPLLLNQVIRPPGLKSQQENRASPRSVIRFIFPALMHESSLTAAHLFSPVPIRQDADTFAPAGDLHNDPPKRLFFPLPYDSVKTNTFHRHVHALLLLRPPASDAQAVSHFVKTVCPKTSGKTLHWNVSLHNRLFLFHTD